jgi:hypothetical protein
VEVVVLNVDLLPNRVDTVVIGDRLFSLPIQVEEQDDEATHAGQMDVDDGNVRINLECLVFSTFV